MSLEDKKMIQKAKSPNPLPYKWYSSATMWETFPQQQRAPRNQKGQQNRKFQKKKSQEAQENVIKKYNKENSIKKNQIINLTSEKRIKETKKI